MVKGVNTGKQVEVERRKQQAIELRKRGYSYRRIAKAIGVSQKTAYKYVMGTLRKLTELNNENVVHLRELEARRIDDMIKGIYEQAKAGNYEAIDRMIKLLDRRAKLYGLDMPARVDVTSGGDKLAGLIINLDDDSAD